MIAASIQDLLTRTYGAFNARDIDAVLAVLHPEVDWPNGMEGGRVHGHAAERHRTLSFKSGGSGRRSSPDTPPPVNHAVSGPE
jgi:hypothetical protein